jgi:cellulose synthase (UDP-forming)
LGPGLGPVQRLLFLPTYWLVALPGKLLLPLVPAVFLWTGLAPVRLGSVAEFAAYPLTTVLVTLLAVVRLAPGAYTPVVSGAVQLYAALRLAPTALATLVRPFGEPFRVTPKGRAAAGGGLDRPNLLLSGGLLALGALRDALWGGPLVREDGQRLIGTAWAFASCLTLFLVLALSFSRPHQRAQARFPWRVPLGCRRLADGAAAREGETVDVSLTGARLALADGHGLGPGDLVELALPGIGAVQASVVRARGRELAVQFEPLTEGQRDALIRQLYTAGLVNAPERGAPLPRLVRGLAWRLFHPEAA